MIDDHLELDPVDWVDPTIGTATSRWIYFSSASRPFGMVNLSPDTDIDGTWKSGYIYGTNSVCGFSHIHAWQLAGILVMPTMNDCLGGPDPDQHRSKFRHQDEECKPGYHAITLDRFDIRVELTSTDRVGFHRYTFGQKGRANVIFNLGCSLGPTDMEDAQVRPVSKRELEGFVVNAPTRRRPKSAKIHFVARFDRDIMDLISWEGDERFSNPEVVRGEKCGITAVFSVDVGEVIQLKVGISHVSAANARRNLEAECPEWNFSTICRDSRDAWNQLLSRIEVSGGTDQQTTKFYTDLWHSCLGRRLVSDVNGEYIDRTGKEPRARGIPLDEQGNPRYHHYNSDAFWGAQWTLNTLWPLVCPKHVEEVCNCLLDYYRNGGLIPRGPSGGNYTFVMTGASTTPFLVNAYMKGIRGFDIELAYEGMRKNAFPGGLMSKAGYEHNTWKGGGIEYYIERGYIPEGREPVAFHVKGAGQTMEYAFQDWCLAQLAKALDKQNDYDLFMGRSRNYSNLFDTQTEFIRPRSLDGSWMEPFDPLSNEGFVESNAWQMTWYVPHDVEGLSRLLGGRDELCKKLNQAFEMAKDNQFTGPTINYGNQPSTETAHIFNYAGKPWLSQMWVREVKEKTQGGTTPNDGYRGDEDQGLMGSLGVLMAIGLFQLRSGCDQDSIYEITTPIFDEIKIHLDPGYFRGEKFTIRAKRNSPDDIYIQRAWLNGRPLDRCWFKHLALASGGTLLLELGPEKNPKWGSAPENFPPSMTPANG